MIDPDKLTRDVMSQATLWDPEGQFRPHYNRSSFMFRHGLADHPLLQLPTLIELAERLEKYRGCYWSNGPVDVNDRWEKGADQRQSLKSTIENIAVNNSLVMLKFVVRDPIAGPFFHDLLAKILQIVGPEMAEDVIVGRATILIASPGRITAYHIDADVNYLLQIAGDKSFAVFDQTDRSLVTDEELERYFDGDQSAACFKPERKTEAITYDLRAGFGVHVPCMAPHWARNGEQVSIAVSCNFDLASVERLGLVYKTNHRLRRLGIRPRSPRDETWRNGAKALGAKTVAAVRGLVGRKEPQTENAGWAPSAARDI